MSNVYHQGKQDARMKERLRFATFRLKCFLWTEQPEAGPYSAFGFASDLSETGAGLYVGIKLPAGAHVRVAFESETGAVYRGIVMWCYRFSFEHHFFGNSVLDHRLGLRLQFVSEAERQRYLGYFREIDRRVNLTKVEKLKK